MKEYICSAYGCCGGKCKLTTQKEILDEKFSCPQGIEWATPLHWIVLTPEMKEAIE